MFQEQSTILVMEIELAVWLLKLPQVKLGLLHIRVLQEIQQPFQHRFTTSHLEQQKQPSMVSLYLALLQVRDMQYLDLR